MVIGIYGEDAHIEFKLIELWGFPQSTSYSGGYDGKWEVDIKSGNYYVKDIAYLSTGELIKFDEELRVIYKSCLGKTKLMLFETDLEISLEMNNRGQLNVVGFYKACPEVDNKLDFEFSSNQSYLDKTFVQIDEMIDSYGGVKGSNAE